MTLHVLYLGYFSLWPCDGVLLPPRKFRIISSARKVMATIIWNSQVVAFAL